jgi:hypothetical protein
MLNSCWVSAGGNILAGPHLEGRTRKLVMNELFDVLVRDYKINGKDHSWCERVTRKHLRPFFGAVPAMKVRPETVAKYIEHRLAERAANATVNREIALLRRAFNLARRSGKINAVQMLPSKLSENNVRKGFFERDDFLTASLSTSRRDQTDRHVRVLERMSEGRDSSFAVIAGGFGEQDHPPRT